MVLALQTRVALHVHSIEHSGGDMGMQDSNPEKRRKVATETHKGLNQSQKVPEMNEFTNNFPRSNTSYTTPGDLVFLYRLKY